MTLCFACGRKVSRKAEANAITCDGQTVVLGRECVKSLKPEGWYPTNAYYPKENAPTLFPWKP